MSRTMAGEMEGGMAMHEAVEPALVIETAPAILLGIPKSEFPWRLAERVKRAVPAAAVLCVDTLERLRAAARDRQPTVIVVDDRISTDMPLAASIAELGAIAPVVAIAPYERHGEIERMVAAGHADFVPRGCEWELLAASLVERRLRSADASGSDRTINAQRSDSSDLNEVFRHEINNPLTGILGNAELLLAHSEKFPPAETQRIRTVVELAVRLRETVRRISNSWPKNGSIDRTHRGRGMS